MTRRAWAILSDREGIGPRLRAVLAAAGYTEPALEEVLRGPLWQVDPVVGARRLGGSHRDTLIRLFLLSAAVSADAARRAVAPLSLERLLRAGLLTRRGDVIKARMRLIPYDGLILACDVKPRDFASMPADYVDGVTPPTRLLAALTVRRPIRAALDLGTGQWRAGPPGGTSQRARGRGGCEPSRASVYRLQCKSQRVAEHRVPAGKPLRTGHR